MVVALLLACVGSDPDLPTATAVRGDLEVRLQFQGELQAKDSQSIITPPIYGRPDIEWIIEDGERVKKGDKLVTFETDDIEAELKEAQQELELAQTQMLQNRKKGVVDEGRAKAAIVGAELDLHLAELSQTDSEAVPRVDRESAAIDLEKARMATGEAQTALDRMVLDKATEAELLQLTVRKNELRVAKMEREATLTTLTAPSDGLVIIQDMWDGGKWKAGSSPWPGVTLITLPDLTEMLVVGWVHEVDAPHLAVDQVATITMDAHPTAPIAGQLTDVAPLAIARGDHKIKHFRTEFALDATNEKMKPGMTVQVDLLARTYPDVVKVPLDAIDQHDGKAVVWVRGVAGFSPVDITVIAEGATEVAVDGIEADAVVALADPETWTGG